MKQIKHVRDLQQNMIELFELIEQGEIPLSEAKELNNAAGKILNCSKVELNYNKFMETKRKIPFIEDATESNNDK